MGEVHDAATAKGNVDQFAQLFHLDKMGQCLIAFPKNAGDPPQKFDIIDALHDYDHAYRIGGLDLLGRNWSWVVVVWIMYWNHVSSFKCCCWEAD